MKSKIQIGIACGSGSEKYVNLLISTIEKTISNDNEIEYLIGITNSNVDKLYISKIQTKNQLKIIEVINDYKWGNRGHARALDELFKHFNSEYGMFIDSDMAILSMDWDIKMKKHLIDNIVIVGCEYGDMPGKYKNFPIATFCMFKTNILKEIGISFMPLSLTHKDKIIINEEQARAFCLSVGDAVILDTGWELPFKIKKNGYDGYVMPVLINNKKSIFVNKKIPGGEYQIDGEVIATHIGHGGIRDFITNPKVIKWRQGIENWFAQNRQGGQK
jgi:hypothetical protein